MLVSASLRRLGMTDVSIANLALNILSAQPITSFTEGSETANRVNAVYELVRDNLQSEHNWNFSRKQARLAKVDETPKMDWAYSYAVPSDCIRMLRCEGDYKFAIYGNRLYSNVDGLNVEYYSKVVDASRFSAGFSHALAYRLAELLCYGITQNAAFAQLMVAKAKSATEEAKWTDGQEGSGTFPIDGTFITARQ